MVQAFVFLAGLPALPFRAGDKIDIVPVDFVADSISTLHMKEKPAHVIYHLSSGADSERFRQVTDAIAAARRKSGPVYLPSLENPSSRIIHSLAKSKSKLGVLATLLKVFWPYLTWDTVFDNSRVVAEMGRSPAPFSKYCYPLLEFSRRTNFHYPFKPWPEPAEKGVLQGAAREARL